MTLERLNSDDDTQDSQRELLTPEFIEQSFGALRKFVLERHKLDEKSAFILGNDFKVLAKKAMRLQEDNTLPSVLQKLEQKVLTDRGEKSPTYLALQEFIASRRPRIRLKFGHIPPIMEFESLDEAIINVFPTITAEQSKKIRMPFLHDTTPENEGDDSWMVKFIQKIIDENPNLQKDLETSGLSDFVDTIARQLFARAKKEISVKSARLPKFDSDAPADPSHRQHLPTVHALDLETAQREHLAALQTQMEDPAARHRMVTLPDIDRETLPAIDVINTPMIGAVPKAADLMRVTSGVRAEVQAAAEQKTGYEIHSAPTSLSFDVPAPGALKADIHTTPTRQAFEVTDLPTRVPGVLPDLPRHTTKALVFDKSEIPAQVSESATRESDHSAITAVVEIDAELLKKGKGGKK